jgi:hypothetical protein
MLHDTIFFTSPPVFSLEVFAFFFLLSAKEEEERGGGEEEEGRDRLSMMCVEQPCA